jgi:hypothetical protein
MGGKLVELVTLVRRTLVEALADVPPEKVLFVREATSDGYTAVPEIAVVRGPLPAPQQQIERMQVISSIGVYVREKPSLSARTVGMGLPGGAVVEVIGNIAADGYHWSQVQSGSFKGGYVAKEFLKPL